MADQALKLKQYVSELGGQGAFARLLSEAGFSCSRTQINLTCNRGALPKQNAAAYKAAINQVLKAHGYDPKRAWKTDSKKMAGGVTPAKKRPTSHQPSANDTQRGKGSMMNITKEYLEPEHLRHFSLQDDPFFDSGDYRTIWLNDRLQRIKHLVEVTAKSHGMMVITGDYGAGKSTLLRNVLGEMLADGKTQIIMPDRLERTAMKGDMLTLAVITQLGGNQRVPRSAVERDQLAKTLLTKAVHRGERPFLVIDEAHDLKDSLFISLKRLWDSGLIFRNIGILLVGAGGKEKGGKPWGLRWDIEGNPGIREFAERARLVDLGRLNEDLPDYLAWRVGSVGGSLERIFAADAVPLLCERAQTAQLVNNLAVRAMREAYLDGDAKVSVDHVLRI